MKALKSSNEAFEYDKINFQIIPEERRRKD